MASVDILLPTCNRLSSLIFTLGGVASQTLTNLHLIVSDQSDQPANDSRVVQAFIRVIEARGGKVTWFSRKPSNGIAEQREFLLEQSSSQSVLYLDDDVYMEPWVVQRMVDILNSQGCAFVGAFPAGLSYAQDIRPQQEYIEYWDGPVLPEAVDPDTPGWERWQLHRAANLFHVSQRLPGGSQRLYKVAWVASCILYDREKLVEVGGFSFWNRLPRFHSGEEVLVQNILMRRWGGCGMIPSGTYYSEMPSTVLNGAGTVDGHALELLPEMIDRYAPETKIRSHG